MTILSKKYFWIHIYLPILSCMSIAIATSSNSATRILYEHSNISCRSRPNPFCISFCWYITGNDAIHSISWNGRHKLRVDLEVISRKKYYAEYSTFRVDDEKSNYLLHVTGYSGTAGILTKKNNHFTQQCIWERIMYGALER